jgi:hypothetical protein
MGTNSEVPHAHHFERCHLLDVVQVEVLELEPILEQHPTDEPSGGDRKAALVEGHERHHEPLGELLTVYIRIKLHMDLQVDKSPVIVKGPFFP